jgi:HNH endonuclease/NUMOD4 motif
VKIEEIWKPVVRNRNYEVSALGRVRRVVGGRGAKIGKVLKNQSNGRYSQVGLFVGNESRKEFVHILVLEAFVGPCPDGYETNHKDTFRTNNALDNLEYCTPTENMKHASAHGLLRFGKDNHSTKLTDEQVIWLREQVAAGRSRHAVAKELGISFQHAAQVVNRKRRKRL